MPSWKPNCLKGVDNQNESAILSSSHNLLNNRNINISSPIPVTPATPSPSIRQQNIGNSFTSFTFKNFQNIKFQLNKVTKFDRIS